MAIIHARPGSAEELAQLVTDAAAQRTPLSTHAGNSKWDLGRRHRTGIADGDSGAHLSNDTAAIATQINHSGLQVDLSALQGVVSYEPAELIVVVAAATPLTQIEALLAAQGQHLAFEPVHWRASATAGGILATAMAGPRRFCAGGVRDYVLGLQFVDGRGRLVRCGGRVVKNVSGYDLWRGLTGSFGTLGLITEICFKLWPRPVTQRTLLLRVTDTAAARIALLSLAQRQEQITGLAYLPQRQAVAVRLEGSEATIPPRIEALQRTWPKMEELDAATSKQIWATLREVEDLRPAPAGTCLWRFVLPAGHWVALMQDLKGLGLKRYVVDWGGGLMWALLAANVDGHAPAARHDGIAWRIATNIDDPNPRGLPELSPALGRLNARLKNACDPGGILNPGNMPW